MFTFEFDQTSKLVNLKISTAVQVCDFGENLEMTVPVNDRKIQN